MKKSIFRFGLLSVVALVVTGVLNYYLNKGSYAHQELGGYVSMVISLLFVFFGIRQYRDFESGGYITYMKAFWVGILIVIFPSVAFGIFDVIYVKFMDPGFMERYYSLSLQKMQASLPPEQYLLKAKQLENEKAMFMNVYFQFAVMALTVFLIGIVVSAVSALILHKKPKSATV